MSRDENISLEEEGLIDKLVAIKEKALQNKLVRYCSALFFVIFAILLFIPILVNNDALKGSSTKKLKEVLGHDILIKGDVTVEILPTPKIIARDILVLNYVSKDSKYNYNAFVKKAEIKLKFFYSSDSSIIKEIKLSGVVAEKRNVNENNQDAEGIDIKNIKKILKEKYKTVNTQVDKSASGFDFDSLSLARVTKSDFSLNKFPRIKIANAKIISYDVYDNKREYNSLHGIVDVSNNKISSEGYFAVEDILTSFESKIVFDKELKDNRSSFLEIKSPSLNFRFDGNFSSNKALGDDFKMRGSIISEIKDLKDFYLSYVGAKGDFAKKLKNNTPVIKIKANISSDQEGSFIDDLQIKSPIINGNGSISIYKSSEIPIIDVLLDVRDADIDSMWSSNSVKSINNSEENKNDSIFGIDKVETFLSSGTHNISQKDFDLTLEIKSKLVIYKNTSLGDLNIYLSSHKNGQLIFNPISFKFPGNGKFHANGELNSSGGYPKFSGKISISGDNPATILGNRSSMGRNLKLDFIKSFNLYSDLALSPSKMDLDNLFVNINDKETEISGDLRYSIVEKRPLFKGNLRINSFDIQDQIKNFNFGKYTHRGSLIEKVYWLNDLSFATNMRLKFDKINYGSENFFDSSLNIKVKRGNIEISDVVIDPKFHNSRANFLIDISKSVPTLDINVSAKSLVMFSDVNKSDKPQYISKTEGVVSYEDTKTDVHLMLRKKTFDQFFNIVSLNGFSGAINVNIQKLLFKNKPLEKFRLHTKLNNGILDNVFLQTIIGDSGFQYKGSIGLKKIKTLSGITTLKNLKIQPIATDFFNVRNIDTTLNASISISSFGGDSESFAKNLDGEIKFSAIAPLAKGYGLKDLIRKMFLPKTNFEELKEPKNIIDNPDSQTRFKSAIGSVIFKKGNAKINTKVKGILSNSVLSGNVSLLDQEVKLAFNTIFMTGSKQKLSPILIATNIHGNIGNLSSATNYDQILEYLGVKKTDKVEKKKSQDEKSQSVKDPKGIRYDNKTLEELKEQRLNRSNTILRKQGIYLPPGNNTPQN